MKAPSRSRSTAPLPNSAKMHLVDYPLSDQPGVASSTEEEENGRDEDHAATFLEADESVGNVCERWDE